MVRHVGAYAVVDQGVDPPVIRSALYAEVNRPKVASGTELRKLGVAHKQVVRE
jgi:hypothetical protein